MSAGKIAHLSRARSAFIEYFFKPATLAGAILILPFMRWASPAKSYVLVQFRQASREAANEIWGGTNQFPPIYKTDVFTEILTEFLEADNAYMVFFDRVMRKYAEKRGWLDGETQNQGEKAARQAAGAGKQEAETDGKSEKRLTPKGKRIKI